MYSNAWVILSSVSAWPVLDWDWPGSKSASKNCLMRSSVLLSFRHDTLEHTLTNQQLGCYGCHMQLTDEQRDIIIAWAVRNPLVRAVHLYDSQVKNPEGPQTDVGLALSMDDGPEETWRLANFISHRRVWKSELETALGLVVQLELANREDTPEAGYVELWRA